MAFQLREREREREVSGASYLLHKRAAIQTFLFLFVLDCVPPCSLRAPKTGDPEGSVLLSLCLRNYVFFLCLLKEINYSISHSGLGRCHGTVVWINLYLCSYSEWPHGYQSSKYTVHDFGASIAIACFLGFFRFTSGAKLDKTHASYRYSPPLSVPRASQFAMNIDNLFVAIFGIQKYLTGIVATG